MDTIEYRNRHRDIISFVPISESAYRVEMPEFCRSHMRCGGKEGQTEIDMNDLGMIDPPGGPYISEGFDIKGQKVSKIRVEGNDIIVEVK